MQLRVAILTLALATTASGTMLEVDFSEAGQTTIELPSTIDDSHLKNPPGYFPSEPPVARVVERIVVTNTGQLPISNPDVRINGRPLLPPFDPLTALGCSDTGNPIALLAAWQDRAIHATTDLEAGRDPVALLQVFGVAFCGEDARALAAISASHGTEVRFARLNGHSAAEHNAGGRWTLIDGDQNLFYLDWDNRTPIGETEILADPLLSLRTQIFGRQASWEIASAWQNTSRFEFVDRSLAVKKFRLKNVPPARNWELLPGEKLVIDLTRSPERAYAVNAELRANSALCSATCVVEFHPRPREKVALPYPVISSGGEEPVYEIQSSGEAPIICQAAASQFPLLHTGSNTIECKSVGNLRVVFEVKSTDRKPTAPPKIRMEMPCIHLEAVNADRLWWQISPDSNFALIPPNLDRTGNFDPKVTLSPLDQTFLSAGGEYFIRARVRHAGVWSNWSQPARFVAHKPKQPKVVRMEGADGDQIRICWEPGEGEILVFGSDRLDFLPEVYGGLEAIRMENGAIRESRPNRNLLAKVPSKEGEAHVPIRACYRLIARDEELLSVPSPLARTAHAPPALILQNRHEKAEGALTGRDLAVEMQVP